MNAGEWAILLALSVLWSGSFAFFKILVVALPPFTLVLGRVGLAAIVLNLLLRARGRRLAPSLRRWGDLLLLGALNTLIPFTLIAFGETRISSGLAAIINATTPIFTVIAGHLFTRSERLSGRKAVGVLLGVAGVALLIGARPLQDAGLRGLVGELACLAASLVYGLAGIYGRRFRTQPPLQVAAGQLTASTVLLIPLSLAVDRPWTLPLPAPAVWMALFGIAFLCTALAFALYFRLLATAGAVNASLVCFLIPVGAVGIGLVFLGERLSWSMLGGMALIGAGLAALDGRLIRGLKRRRAAVVPPGSV